MKVAPLLTIKDGCKIRLKKPACQITHCCQITQNPYQYECDDVKEIVIIHSVMILRVHVNGASHCTLSCVRVF